VLVKCCKQTDAIRQRRFEPCIPEEVFGGFESDRGQHSPLDGFLVSDLQEAIFCSALDIEFGPKFPTAMRSVSYWTWLFPNEKGMGASPDKPGGIYRDLRSIPYARIFGSHLRN
jgi:hypothetical protein